MLEGIPEEPADVENNIDVEVSHNLLVAPANRDDRREDISNAETVAQTLTKLPLHRRVYLLFFPTYEFTKILVSSVIPALTILIPLFYTGQIDDRLALSVASQFSFVSVVLKVLQDTIVNGLFYMVGRDYRDNRKHALQSLKICTLVIFFLGVLLSGIVMLFTEVIVEAIKTHASITLSTERYLYISAVSFPLILVNEAIKTHMLITQHVLLVVSTLCQVVITLMLNVLLFGTQDIGTHWGIEHLGIYKVIELLLILLTNVVFFFLIEDITPSMFAFQVPLAKGSKEKLVTLFRVSWANFGESVVRNFFYLSVTLTFVNQLGPASAAAWNVTNSITWQFLLLPAFAVASQVKVSIALNADKPHLKTTLRQVAKQNASTLSAWCLLVGGLSTIFWPWMANLVSPNNTEVQNISHSMFLHVGWVFIVYSFSNAANGLFYGLGETRYVLYQCGITNGLVYLTPWVLYIGGWIEPSYSCVLGLYVTGILVSGVLTVAFSFTLYKSLE